jgi:hypothetical protein
MGCFVIQRAEAEEQQKKTAAGTTNPRQHYRPWEGSVPHSGSGIIPRSSLLDAGQLGFWEFGEGGTIGWRVGQIGSVYKQPETEVDDSYHSWRVPSKWKRVQREASKGSKKKAPCIDCIISRVCMYAE